MVIRIIIARIATIKTISQIEEISIKEAIQIVHKDHKTIILLCRNMLELISLGKFTSF